MATKQFLGLTHPYKVLYMDIEYLIFSIFILSNEPDMCFLLNCLGSEQKVHVNKLSCHPKRSLEGSLNFWVCFLSSSNAALSRAFFLGRKRAAAHEPPPEGCTAHTGPRVVCDLQHGLPWQADAWDEEARIFLHMHSKVLYSSRFWRSFS